MTTFLEALEDAVQTMNIAFEQSQLKDDEFSAEFQKLFEKAATKVERMLKIKQLAEGKSV